MISYEKNLGEHYSKVFSYSTINSYHGIIVKPGSYIQGSADVAFFWTIIDPSKRDEAVWFSSMYIKYPYFSMYNGFVYADQPSSAVVVRITYWYQRPALF